MRRLIVLAAALALGAAPGCRRTPPVIEVIEDGNAPPRAAIRMTEPGGESQLLGGFHPPDYPGWCWTKGKFSAMLGAPPGAAEKGARLTLVFALTDSVFSRRKTVTISALVESSLLAPETYSQPGPYTYTRDVPAAAFGSGPVKADFALDNYLAAGEIEGRELGLIFKSVELSAK